MKTATASNQPENGVRDYFAFLRERYRIRLRRHTGQPWPWTHDPVLKRYRICNVHREDDRTTTAFRETVRDPLRDDSHVLLATIAWRWFNRVETGEVLQPFLMAREDWRRPEIERLLQKRQERDLPIFTGAFMVNSEPGRAKLPAILSYVDWCYEHLDPEEIRHECRTKEAMFNRIKAIPRLGPLLAYQIVTDLEHTALLESASDLNTFAATGPGCSRAMGLCFHGRDDVYTYNGTRANHEEMLRLMIETLAASVDPRNWPADWPRLQLSDIRHGFCEYSKYLALRRGARQSRVYRPAA